MHSFQFDQFLQPAGTRVARVQLSKLIKIPRTRTHGEARFCPYCTQQCMQCIRTERILYPASWILYWSLLT